MRGRRLLAVALPAVLVAAGVAEQTVHAQAVAVTATAVREPSDAIAGDGQSLTERLAVARGRQLIYSPTPEERLRAVDRLARAGTPEAIEALLEAMETGSPLARDASGRLAVVRALAEYAGRPEVRTFLVREMLDAGARRDVTSGMFALVRDTAALALARRADPNALEALSSAAALRGPVGDSARAALVAVPPRTLEAILFEQEADADSESEEPSDTGRAAPGAPSAKTPPAKAAKPAAPAEGAKKRTPRALSAAVLGLLGDIGDLRAIPALREELDRSDRPSRAAAALALAKMGDATVAPVVRSWLKENDPRFVAAAAEILVVLGDQEAPSAVVRALSLEPVRSQAVRLAYELASPAVVEPLAKLLPALEPADRVRAVMALGRAGAAKRVAEKLTDPELGPAAISALAGCPSADTAQVLAAGFALDKAGKRRAFVRAAIIRAVALRERAPGLEDTLEALSTSNDVSDVETAALGRVALGIRSAKQVLADVGSKSDPRASAAVFGAARGALARGDEDKAAFASLVATIDPERPSLQQLAAGVALLSDDGESAVPFRTLLRLAETGGALASLAARALPARADESMRDRLIALLEGGDPTVRVGIAQGLATSENEAAVSWLSRAYAREEDTLVRRALVASLARRTEPQRARPLLLARDLDPDAEVRAIAARGLSSVGRKAVPPVGLQPALAAAFAVVATDGGAREHAFRLVLPSGIAIPLVSAQDGGLVVPGMPFGKATLELARTETP